MAAVAKASSNLLSSNPYFRVLGSQDASVVVLLPNKSVAVYSRTSMCQPATLISLAPHAFWAAALGVSYIGAKVSQIVGSDLIREADRLGQFDPSNIVGRGMSITGKDHVWHLGNRLLRNSKKESLDVIGGKIYSARPVIEISGPLSTQKERLEIARAVCSYRWESKVDGIKMLGWMASSVVGGALPWRPHLWFLGVADSGKSWFQQEVVVKLLGPFVTRAPASDSSPAGVAYMMRSDSLPLVLDEAEPDQSYTESLVQSTRIAAGGDGPRLRADGHGGVIAMHQRFSAMMCSTKAPKLDQADSSRFEIVRLSETGVANWPKVRDAIRQSVGGKIPEKVRASIVADGSKIIARADSIATQLQSMGGRTRRNNIHAALLAGAEWFAGGKFPPHILRSPRTARADSDSDAEKVLHILLNLRVSTLSGSQLSLADLINDSSSDGRRSRTKMLASCGIKVDSALGLMIAPNHPQMAKTLRMTKWKNLDLAKLLTQLPGSVREQNPRSLGGFRMRCVRVPLDRCEEIGLDLSNVDLKKKLEF